MNQLIAALSFAVLVVILVGAVRARRHRARRDDPDGFYVYCRVCSKTSRKRCAWSLGCPQARCAGTSKDICPVSISEQGR
jgi:hypothetical protein